jgi:hypothetical protein
VKVTFHAKSTLSLFSRATAFFALLGFLIMTSCGEEKPTRLSVLQGQAEALSSIAEILNSVAEGADPSQTSVRLESVAETLKELRREMASLGKPKAQEVDLIINHKAYQEATAALQEALERLQKSGKSSPEVITALNAIHDSAPMPGEGSLP